MLYDTRENRRWVNASILYEMPNQEGNEQYPTDYNEEWQAGYTGNMRYLRDKDVQDRKRLEPISAYKRVMDSIP